MLNLLHSFRHIRTLANSAMPIIIKCVIFRIRHIGFLGELRSTISSTDVFLIKGKEKSSNLRLTTLVFGDMEFSHYFANLVYSSNYEVEAFMKTVYYNIPRVINHNEVDVIIVQADGALSRFLSRRGFLTLPKVHFVLDIATPSEKLFARMSRLRRRNINKIKKLEFTYEITREPKKLDFFFHKFYLPYITKRHGKSAKTASFFAMKRVYRKGGLLLVKLSGKYVSGILYGKHGDKITACCLGIYEGKKQHLDEGASQAALHFLIEWSKQQGFKEIDYGLSNPFMKDGLFAYKRSWGMRVKPCGNFVYGLKVSNLDTPVIEFLSENPLVFTESESLSGLIFRKAEEKNKEVFNASSHYTLGLARIVVGLYSAGDSSAFSSNPHSEEESTKTVNKKKVTPHLFKLWSKRGGLFFQEYPPY